LEQSQIFTEMSLSDIRLHKPRSIAEAVKLLGELGDSRLLAGGTDLLVDIKQGLIRVKNLISLQEIEELGGIEEEGGKIRIGAMVTPRQILSSDLINEHIPALAEAARTMASTQIRALATIGGNIASAVPSADLPPLLLAAGASVILDCGSPREVGLSEFFTGPRTTVCGEGEVLASVYFPLPPRGTGFSYKKVTLREANALAVVGVAARITLSREKVKKAAIVLGAVAPTPLLANKASDLLIDKAPSEALFDASASLAKKEGSPISDIRGSAWYRQELIQVLTRRALDEALARARAQI
jgi:carbon-monoxide dehydrogenase medium subunit